MAAEVWVGWVHRAAQKISKELVDGTIRGRFVPRALAQRGRVKTNVNTSYETKYPVLYSEAPVRGFGHGTTITYQTADYLKNGVMDWRGLYTSHMIHLYDQKVIGRGPWVMVDEWKKVVPWNVQAMNHRLHSDFYCDGSATGNERDFEGLATFFKAAATPGAADIVAQPHASQTYHDLQIAVDQGGTSWSTNLSTYPNATMATDWPEGTGQPEYDYNSPIMSPYDSTSWPGGQTGWIDNCLHQLTRIYLWLKNRAGVTGASLLCILSGDMFAGFSAAFLAKYQVFHPAPEAGRYGIPDVMNYNGLMVQTEYGVPAGRGYVVDLDTVQMMIVGQGEVIDNIGPNLDEDSASYKWFAVTPGNYRFRPRNCAMIAARADFPTS